MGWFVSAAVVCGGDLSSHYSEEENLANEKRLGEWERGTDWGVRPRGGGNECDPESALLKEPRETGQSEETITMNVRVTFQIRNDFVFVVFCLLVCLLVFLELAEGCFPEKIHYHRG